MSDETTGARTFAGRMRRFRIGFECGEVFEQDEDFDGVTLTIEITAPQDGENLLRILAGWEPVPDNPIAAEVQARIAAREAERAKRDDTTAPAWRRRLAAERLRALDSWGRAG